ncbi:hypothetical protein OEA41_005342 [Lepraria neglecta]|uniref:Uncharacterized protein n=1 Tax=Lepraria neglecta TaxID=209136 RepID=A0AAE0DGP5_9LECA|nr:hypothetical protein OEA41_005342 [Lepraria neglecta]
MLYKDSIDPSTPSSVLHPLAKHSGPLFWRALRFPFIKAMISGDLLKDSMINMAPWSVWHQMSSLSRTQLCGETSIHKTFCGRANGKINPQERMRRTQIMLDFRKILAPAFSEKSVYEQEAMIRGHVDLIRKLHEAIENVPSKGAAVVDVLQWFNYTTFEVIGSPGALLSNTLTIFNLTLGFKSSPNSRLL